jgi:hypothetical protein
VVEVNRPDRAARRRQGKGDPVDAEAAARAVQAKDATGLPKSGDAKVEMLRCLRVARSTAVKARTQAINALKALVVTAPRTCASSCAACRPPSWCAPRPAWNRSPRHDHGGHQAGAADPRRAPPGLILQP